MRGRQTDRGCLFIACSHEMQTHCKGSWRHSWGRDGGCHGEVRVPQQSFSSFMKKNKVRLLKNHLPPVWGQSVQSTVFVKGKEATDKTSSVRCCPSLLLSSICTLPCGAMGSTSRRLQACPQPVILCSFILVRARACRGNSLRQRTWPPHRQDSFYWNKPQPECWFALIAH